MPSTSALDDLIAPILQEYTMKIAAIVEEATMANVRKAIDSALGQGVAVERAPVRAAPAVVEPAAAEPVAPAPRSRRKASSKTPAQQRALVLQGRYLGRLRKLTGKTRDEVKAIAARDGVAAGVKAADRALAAMEGFKKGVR